MGRRQAVLCEAAGLDGFTGRGGCRWRESVSRRLLRTAFTLGLAVTELLGVEILF